MFFCQGRDASQTDSLQTQLYKHNGRNQAQRSTQGCRRREGWIRKEAEAGLDGLAQEGRPGQGTHSRIRRVERRRGG
jgi:hypothetical protein